MGHRDRRAIPRWRVLGCGLVVIALAACGADGPGTDAVTAPSSTLAEQPLPAAGPEAGRSVRNEGILTRDAMEAVDVWTWIGQPRHLEGSTRITVPVRFESDEPVTVTSISLRTPHFEPLPAEPKQSLLHPGRKVDLQVDLGPPRCGPIDATGAEVHLTAQLGRRAPTDLVLPVPTWLLDDLRDRQCTLVELTAAVDVGFGAFDPPAGTGVETELVIRRRATTAPVIVERVAGSVLLTLAPHEASSPAGTLPAGQTEVRIPVTVTATRCDAHGLAGSQRTFVFSTWISLGDSPPVYVELRPAPDLEAAMRATLDACIRAGG